MISHFEIFYDTCDISYTTLTKLNISAKECVLRCDEHVGVARTNTPTPSERKWLPATIYGDACQAVWPAGTRYRFV